jgi:hypothetical protein
MMMLGWVLGRFLRAASPPRAGRALLAAGAAALGLFAVVRGLNGYGNLLLLRADGSLVQWLHVWKYPPALTFTALELGLMALCLAFLLHLQRRGAGARSLGPLLVLGQTALFFYLLHVHVLKLEGWLLGAAHRQGLVATYLAAFATVVVLYPLCAWYRGYKQARPTGWARYI